jgi:hypothetical protein
LAKWTETAAPGCVPGVCRLGLPGVRL